MLTVILVPLTGALPRWHPPGNKGLASLVWFRVVVAALLILVLTGRM